MPPRTQSRPRAAAPTRSPQADAPPKKGSLQRADILQAAARLFAQKGYGGTKLHEIVAAVGLTRTAFYYYFASKEQLLGALVEDITFTLEKRSTAITGRKDLGPPEMLRQLVLEHASWVLDHSVEFRFLSTVEADMPPALLRTHDRAKRALLDSFTIVIRKGVALGYFRTAEPTVAALSVIGMCNWGAWWYKRSGPLTGTAVAELFVEQALRIVHATSRPQTREEQLRDELTALKRSAAALERLVRAPS
jgi:AcrR family transcriptional regulator